LVEQNGLYTNQVIKKLCTFTKKAMYQSRVILKLFTCYELFLTSRITENTIFYGILCSLDTECHREWSILLILFCFSLIVSTINVKKAK